MIEHPNPGCSCDECDCECSDTHCSVHVRVTRQDWNNLRTAGRVEGMQYYLRDLKTVLRLISSECQTSLAPLIRQWETEVAACLSAK